MTEMTGMKALACAVIGKAVEDLQTKPSGKWQYDRDVVSAKEFLCQLNPDLKFWCSMAGFDAEAVTEHARKMIGVTT